MDSSIQPVDPKPVGAMVPPARVFLAAEPFDASADAYAEAELELRHERIERMIERARDAD